MRELEWVELSVIDDDIGQLRRRPHACIRATRGHSEYSP